MNTPRNRTAMSPRRKLGWALLAAFLGAAFGAAVFAAGPKPDFTIAASPSLQKVSQGQAATYTVTVTRVNGFAGSVSLKATELPRGATASWKLSDGTTSNVVPPNLDSAMLTIQTASNTPKGKSTPDIKATSGTLKHTTSVTLEVEPAAKPNFALAASPASQTVLQNGQTSYTATVTRTGGFGDPVSLKVTGLPKGATASWSPSSTVPGTSSSATLQIQVAGNTLTGNYNLTIKGTATITGKTVTRSTPVTLIIQKSQGFQIAGNLGAQLSPGMKAPLNLVLTNPQSFNLKVTNLSVGVEDATSEAGCSGTQNFRTTQIPAARYPITLPAGQTRTLAQLGVASGDQPQVEMLNQPWDQDACKNATISLVYGGSAGK